MRVILLGAGASKAYEESPTRIRMPLAREVFAAFTSLPSSTHLWTRFAALRQSCYLPLNDGTDPLVGAASH